MSSLAELYIEEVTDLTAKTEEARQKQVAYKASITSQDESLEKSKSLVEYEADLFFRYGSHVVNQITIRNRTFSEKAAQVQP